MHSCQDIEENRYFSNGGTNLHIHAIDQGRPEDNQVEFLQGPHWIVNPPKNLVLNNIRRFTQMANGIDGLQPPAVGRTAFDTNGVLLEWGGVGQIMFRWEPVSSLSAHACHIWARSDGRVEKSVF